VNLATLLEEKKILVCCGGGGVGKTTTAAAIAVRAATLGHRTLVLTIDPARRLANALGVSEFGNEVREVPMEKFAAAGIAPRGELHAMMLDTKRTFDELVERFSGNADMRDAILGNPIYQQLSDTLVGSREYMAMEKLYELHTEGGFDIIVLDTPPTKHALDFLDAPDRIMDFLEGKVIHILIKPYLMAGRIGFKVFRRGATSLFGILEKVTGMEFLRDLSDFILSFKGMYDGFKQRAKRVKALLGRGETGFILVSSPNKLLVEETVFFYDQLVAHKMHVDAVIVNKVHLPVGTDGRPHRTGVGNGAGYANPSLLSGEGGKRLAQKMAEASDVQDFRTAAARLLQNYAHHHVLAEMDARNVASLRAPVGDKAAFIEIPMLNADVYDFEGLSQLNDYLFQS
jgi:anion-transporting  ArsA/GET3 family ATPase